jgi:methionyl-tRNA formyltransferase
MRVVFFGSGAFGLPTFERLIQQHQIAAVVTQPDRPAGRHRTLTPTPIGQMAQQHALLTIKPENVNTPELVQQIHALHAQAFVVIAFGQKLSPSLLAGSFAINLHASLLPKYRGAAPINWAIIRGESHTGVSVITLADRMDAGAVLAQAATAIDPLETAGELHDRLAVLGPDAILKVLAQFQAGTLRPVVQDESQATHAPKLSKADGTAHFEQPADCVRARVHGLTPWPGCWIRVGPVSTVRLVRVQDVAGTSATPASVTAPPGTVLDDHTIACQNGRLRVLEVQPPNGRIMSLQAYINGHGMPVGERCGPV